MAQAKFSIGQLNITGYLRIIARETINLTAEVANITYAPPQPTTRNVVIADLNPIPHQFEFYESTDGIALGTLLAIYVIDVGKIFQAAIIKYEFTVDGGDTGNPDPAGGSKEWNQTELAGYTADRLIVSERAIGFRSFEQGEIEVLEDGGFKFPDAGEETFISTDFWTVLALQTITTQDPVNITRGRFKDIIEFDADVTIDETHRDCLLEARGADSSVLTLTFPDLDTIPNDTSFGVTTESGLQRYVAFQLASGDVCRFKGAEKNIFWLGKGETIYLIVKNGIMKVADYQGDYARVGEIVKKNLAPINGIAEVGGWYQFEDIPRYYYEFVSQISPSELSAFTGSIVTERTKHAIDEANTRFWMPDTGGYFERNVDPNGDIDSRRTSTPTNTRYTGTVQSDMVGPHQHDVFVDFYNEGGNGQVASGGDPKEFDDFQLTTATNSGTETTPKNIAVNSWRII